MKLLAVLTILASTQAFAAEVKITQKDKAFDKKEITIKKGDSISFFNAEKDITHNVFSLGPKNPFELKTQAPGQASAVEFKEEGVTDVECAIHSGMKLKVKVEK